MGILIYGFMRFNKNEGEVGPPPLITNFLVAINKLASEGGETKDNSLVGAIFHASDAIFRTDILEKKDIEEMHKTVSKILKNLKEHKTKNSPMYSQLIETLWTTFPKMVLLHFLIQHNFVLTAVYVTCYNTI